MPRTGGRTDADAVAAALTAIAVDDTVGRPGTGPVALGALPFDPTAPAELLVPSVVVGRADDGTRWVTTIAPADAEPTADEVDAVVARGLAGAVGFARDAGLTPADEGPARYDVRSERPPTAWCEAVAEATRRLQAGEARKVVLARAVDVVTDRPLRAGAVLGQLRRSYPASHLFSIDGFVGATPELLVARAGDRRAGPPHGRHRPPQRRSEHRRPPRRRPARIHQHPRRTPPHHRHGPRHPAAVVLVPRRGGRALHRGHGQRAAPRHPAGGSPVEPAGVGGRARHRAAPHAGGRRRAGMSPSPSSTSSNSSTGAATPVPSGGSTPPATAPGPSASARPSWPAPPPGYSPGWVWWPTRCRSRSWPRPGRSCRPCSAP